MRLPLRRIVLGFAVGASAGWVASLLRRPKDAPPGTGADAAEHMPVEEFGDPVDDAPSQGAAGTEGAEEIAQEPTAPVEAYGDAAVDAGESDSGSDSGSDGERPPPRKALPETVTPPPGTETIVGDGSAEPAKPTPRRRVTKAAKAAKAADAPGQPAEEPVSQAVREAVREGRAQVDEHLAGLDEVAPAPPAAPEARRRRKRAD